MVSAKLSKSNQRFFWDKGRTVEESSGAAWPVCSLQTPSGVILVKIKHFIHSSSHTLFYEGFPIEDYCIKVRQLMSPKPLSKCVKPYNWFLFSPANCITRCLLCFGSLFFGLTPPSKHNKANSSVFVTGNVRNVKRHWTTVKPWIGTVRSAHCELS